MRRALVASILLITAGCRGGGTPTSFTETRSFPAATGKVVRLDLGSLDLDARVADTDAIGVEVVLEARSSAPGAARRWIEAHQPVYSDGPSRLEIEVSRRSRGTFLVGYFRSEGEVRLTIPRACRLEVETASGDVVLDGGASLDGAVRVTTASGDLDVRGGAREVIVRTASGDVSVDADELDRFEADTASGDVVLRSGARQAIVDTASGEVDLFDLSGELSVRTTSGDVRARWSRPPASGRVDVTTTSGEVDLRLPARTVLAGRARTSSGRLDSDWTGSWDRRRTSLHLPATSAGVTIELRTTSGDIGLRHADGPEGESTEEAGGVESPAPAEAPEAPAEPESPDPSR
jgi:lia operon protein LiaG